MAIDQPPPPESKSPARRRRPGVVAGALVGALVAVFAVLNAQSVSVDWIGTTTNTPLIVVIVLSLTIGYAAGALSDRRHRRGRR